MEALFRERTDDFLDHVEHIDYEDLVESAEPEGHLLDPEVQILEDRKDVYKFTLSDARRFPRFLSQTLLQSDPPRLTYDHSVFWGWTGAYIADHPIQNNDRYSELVADFFQMIHFMLFKTRQLRATMFYENIPFQNDFHSISLGECRRVMHWANPSIDPMTFFADRYASTGGFTILDGLITHHCDVLDSQTGRVNQDHIQSPWRPDDETIGGEISFHDKIQTWIYYQATDEIQQTLLEINDLSDYDIGTLCKYIPGIEKRVKKEMTSTQHFFRVFAKLRNENVHGQEMSRIIGSIVVTLCCMVLWDSVGSEDYESRSSKIENLVESTENYYTEESTTPLAFFPVDRIGDTFEDQILLPSDSEHPQDL